MSSLRASVRGLVATLGSPKMLVGLWLVNLIVALPLAFWIGKSIDDSVRGSLVEEHLRDGFDMGWYGEYLSGAGDIERTLRPSLVGAGAFFDNLEDWLTGKLFAGVPAIVGVGLLYALLWAFLLGGVLDRFARPSESAVSARFAQACGIYFFRFVRLALVSGVLYFLVFRLHGWMFDRLEVWTRDVTREWTVLWASLAAYGLTALLLTLIHMSFGYAKIATVVENRRSVLLAALRGVRFVLAFPGKTFALYYGLLAVSTVLLVLFAWIAPGPGQSGVFTILVAFVVAQAFLVIKLVMRLTLCGAQTALFKTLASRSL